MLWDQGNRNHNNYGIKSWPTAYLIGADGIVFWQGNPARLSARSDEIQQFRQLLEERLREVKKSDQ